MNGMVIIMMGILYRRNEKFLGEINNNKKIKLLCNRPRRPVSLLDVEIPIFSRKSVHSWRWGCQP
jgi:hypothetical protein